MRHYLATQDDLFVLAMRLCAARNAARIAALAPVGGVLDQLQALLEQLLPLDEERRLEAEVWLAFVARAQTKPALQEVLKEINDGLLWCIAVATEVLVVAGVLAPGPQQPLETERLLALVNGLTINALLWPQTMTPQRQRDLLQGHLRNLGRSD